MNDTYLRLCEDFNKATDDVMRYTSTGEFGMADECLEELATISLALADIEAERGE